MTTKLTHIAGLLLLLSGLGLSPSASADTPNRPENQPIPSATDSRTVIDNQTKTNDRLAWQRVGSPLTLES